MSKEDNKNFQKNGSVMQSLFNKLIWFGLLIGFIVLVAFLCFCFVPLEGEDSRMDAYKESYHDSFHKKTDVPECSACHPLLWRYNVRMNNIKEKWNEGKKEKK